MARHYLLYTALFLLSFAGVHEAHEAVEHLAHRARHHHARRAH